MRKDLQDHAVTPIIKKEKGGATMTTSDITQPNQNQKKLTNRMAFIAGLHSRWCHKVAIAAIKHNRLIRHDEAINWQTM